MSEAKPRKFTSTEIKQFNGLNGQPIYIVYKGKIYDVSTSRLWTDGKHMGQHTRDQNLTEALRAAPHGEDNILRFPFVGELDEPALQVPAALSLEPKPVVPQPKPAVQPQGLDRRGFLKLAAAAGGVLTVAAVASTLKAATFVPTSTTATEWPRVVVTNINNLAPLAPATFHYPLTNTPNIIVRLGTAAEGGVGPNGDIVAFSSVCQHLGCIFSFVPRDGSPICNLAYKAPTPMGYCCCHGSQFDFTQRAKVLGGPSPRPAPQVQLDFDSGTGDITAVGMGAPTIFGHGPPGTMDPALVKQYDLQGGEVVTQATVATTLG